MSDTNKSDIEANNNKTMEHAASTLSVHSKRAGMESSVLRFNKVNFTVGHGDKKKLLLTDVNATVRWGRVLASKSCGFIVKMPCCVGFCVGVLLARYFIDYVDTTRIDDTFPHLTHVVLVLLLFSHGTKWSRQDYFDFDLDVGCHLRNFDRVGDAQWCARDGCHVSATLLCGETA